MNAVACPAVDRGGRQASTITPTLGRQDKLFARFLRQVGLIDVWRVLYPSVKDYSFYSAPHGTYSRIDMFLVNGLAMSNVIRAEINSISWSDHADIALYLHTPKLAASWSWRLNSSLLRDPEVVSQLRTLSIQYFQDNPPGETSLSTIWAAHKAVMRGHLIKIATHRKRTKLLSLVTLQQSLRRLEMSHKSSPSPELLSDLLRTRSSLKRLLLDDVAKQLLWSRRMFFEKANKLDTLLARSLKPRSKFSSISAVKTVDEVLVNSPQEICAAFTAYYSDLYNHSPHHNLADKSHLDAISSFLDSLSLPHLEDSHITNLSATILEEEVNCAISALGGTKAPGPDGFSGGYYKVLRPELVPFLTAVFNDCAEGGSLHPDLLVANIALIPKEGRDPAAVESYRPISLINFDAKIFAKVLANRLSPLLQDLVHPDQVGFVPNRQLFDNTRRNADLIWWLSSRATPSLILSLDAEKAFDRVEWPFLFATLSRLGLPDFYINMVRALYSGMSAQVRVPGSSPIRFPICNGTRQGCPLSPLLFLLSLEPLLAAIRDHPEIRGVQVGGESFTVSAYADDILLTLTDPISSLSHLRPVLSDFGEIAGFRINYTKSCAMPLYMPHTDTASIESGFGFRLAPSELSYLGILLTANPTALYSKNFTAMVRQIKCDLEHWCDKPISWIGRIHSVKMNILPRILFLFQTLPLLLTRRDLAGLQQAIDSFIWQNKRHRVARRILYRPKTRGGLGLPNLYLYYCAAQLTQVVAWHSSASTRRWVALENAFMFPDRPDLYIWLPRASRPILRTTCPSILTSLRLFDLARTKFELMGAPSPLTPLLRNREFPPGLRASDFRGLAGVGLLRYRDLYRNGRLITFSELQERGDLSPSSFFRFLQIRHFATTQMLERISTAPLSTLEHVCMADGPLKGLISRLYLLLSSSPGQWGPLTYCDKWEVDLCDPLPGDEWEDIWEQTSRSSICVTHQEQSYKTLLRWYVTPVSLYRMVVTSSDFCWRDCGEKGTYIHMWWDCPVVRRFWSLVHTEFQKIFHRQLPMDPWAFLLSRPLSVLSRPEQLLFNRLALAVRRALAASWRQSILPSWSVVTAKIVDACLMDELTAKVRDTMSSFSKTWSLWEEYSSAPNGN
uniref:Reverse transcriptase domain-containing protein n=1 Tax=Leptobrachium leishanense TaxID=445787 RepID=A0A8C5MEQ8_9ANUR